jgi:tRNA G37 N-methylase Trm5
MTSYKNHLTVAHERWKDQCKPNTTVIDATAGNGHDALFIAKSLLENPDTELICIDIQKKAIESTQERLSILPPSQSSKIVYIQNSHCQLPKSLFPIRLITYNLGYLPGADKTLTTRVASTIKSLQSGLSLLCPGGMISLTIYPGHEEGQKEFAALIPFLKGLNSTLFSVEKPLNPSSPKAPQLFIITRI